MIMNVELKTMWEKAVMVYFRPYAWRDWGKPQETSNRIGSVPWSQALAYTMVCSL